MRDSPSRVLGRVKTAIYEANDTKNVSITHEKYRYDTAIKHRYKTIFFWCYNTYGMPQFWNTVLGALYTRFIQLAYRY